MNEEDCSNRFDRLKGHFDHSLGEDDHSLTWAYARARILPKDEVKLQTDPLEEGVRVAKMNGEPLNMTCSDWRRISETSGRPAENEVAAK